VGKGWAAAVVLLITVTGALGPVHAAEYFKVQVTRVSQDLYKTAEGFFIKTRYCYEYSFGEDAILKWDGPGYAGSELIFVNGGKCDVDRVLR